MTYDVCTICNSRPCKCRAIFGDVREGKYMARAGKKVAKGESLALVFDTETTGLIDNRSLALDKLPEVIEFCGILVDLNNGKQKHVVDTFIKPERWPDHVVGGRGKEKTVTQITGITWDMVKDAPTFKEAWLDIVPVLESAPIVIAHNASFDREMMDIEAERLARKIEWPPLVCTIEQTIYVKGARMNLTTLHEWLFGTKFENPHRARGDVEALVKCCVELRKRGEL